MNKYQYSVNGNVVTKKDMVAALQERCLNQGDVDEAERKFKKNLHYIETGSIIVIGKDIFNRIKI